MTPYTRIFEAKQVGVLYHFTSSGNLERILKDDILRKSHKFMGVSFTRDKNLYETGSYFKAKERNIDTRIAIDGDRLSQKYKIRPFNFPGGSRFSDPESEEMVNTDIPNIRDYILSVDFIKSKLDDGFEDLRGISDSEMTTEDFVKSIERYGVKVNLI